MSRSLPLLLLVHPSAVVRNALLDLIESGGRFACVTAQSAAVARAKLTVERPAAALVALEEPDAEALALLRRLDEAGCVTAALTPEGTAGRSGVAARAAGAVAVLRSPNAPLPAGYTAELDALASLLESNVLSRLERARAEASAADVARTPVPHKPVAVQAARAQAGDADERPAISALIAIGASTGGPDALGVLLSALPSECPPVLVVQHMPAGATADLASRLDELCQVSVREAHRGDRLRPGQVLVAPGGQHMSIRSDASDYVVGLSTEDTRCGHKPCVDMLFASLAGLRGLRMVGVLLTGMGDDGADGLLTMRRAGARTVAQDRASCAVFGMPARAIERGAAELVLPLEQIAMTALQLAQRGG